MKPIIILESPQLAENIGAVARVMSNFGFRHLRLVTPRSWPTSDTSAIDLFREKEKAIATAAHGSFILDDVAVYDSFQDAISDIKYLVATASLSRNMEKKQYTPQEVVEFINDQNFADGEVAFLFGCERSGLSNSHIVLADCLVSIPTDSLNQSMNLSHAVCVMCYEYIRGKVEIKHPANSPLASKHELVMMFEHLESQLYDKNFFQVEEKIPGMSQNIRAMFLKAALTKQEVQTLRGMIRALSE